MIKLSKRMNQIQGCINSRLQYSVLDGLRLLQNLTQVKFVESVDVAINLGINTQKSDQNIRNSVMLPYGTGKHVRIAVFTQGDTVELVKKEGITLVGLENLYDQIKSEGGCNAIDVVLASPDVMPVVGKLGSVLGPKGLMPNPKMGTVSLNIIESIRNIRSGQIRYKNDKNGIVHAAIGKINFDVIHLQKNLEAFLLSIKQIKPIQCKGTYIKKIFVSTTMGGAIWIDHNSLDISLY